MRGGGNAQVGCQGRETGRGERTFSQLRLPPGRTPCRGFLQQHHPPCCLAWLPFLPPTRCTPWLVRPLWSPFPTGASCHGLHSCRLYRSWSHRECGAWGQEDLSSSPSTSECGGWGQEEVSPSPSTSPCWQWEVRRSWGGVGQGERCRGRSHGDGCVSLRFFTCSATQGCTLEAVRWHGKRIPARTGGVNGQQGRGGLFGEWRRLGRQTRHQPLPFWWPRRVWLWRIFSRIWGRMTPRISE